MPKSDSRITLRIPQADTVEKVNALGGKTFVLDFDVAQTEITRDNVDMVIAANSGGSIKLEGLYTPNATGTPTFELQNGTTFDTFQFVEVYGSESVGSIMPLAAAAPSIELSVSEQGLSDNPSVSSEIRDIPAGYTIDTSKDGWKAAGDKFELDASGGKFVYDAASNTMSFTLTKAIDHGGESVKEVSATITLKDSAGKSVTASAVIAVEDSIADGSLTVDYASGKEYVHYTQSFTGEWNINYGPDGSPSGKESFTLHYQLTGYEPGSVEITLGQTHSLYVKDESGADVLYGTIEFYSYNTGDGYFIFTPKGPQYNPSNPTSRPLAGILNMRLEASDADGAALSTNTTHNAVWVQDFGYYPNGTAILTSTNDPAGDYADDPAGVILEKDLANGPITVDIALPNNPRGSADSHFTVDTSLPSGWQNKGNGMWELDLPDSVGKLVLDKSSSNPLNHKLQYIISEAMDHTNDQVFDMYDVIPIYLTKGNSGSKYPIDVVVKIIDDEPEVALDYDGSKPHFSGDAIDGVFALDYGVDGAAANKPLLVTYKDDNGVEIKDIEAVLGKPIELKNGGETIGELTLKADGTFVFKPASGSGTATISVTAQDGDGDLATDSVDIVYMSKPSPVIDFNEKGLFDEGYLKDGSLGSKPGELTRTMDIDPDWKIDTSSGWTQSGSTWTKAHSGGIFTYDAAKDTLSFTLQNAVGHKAKGRDQIEETMDFVLLHKQTNSASDCTAKLTIKDDIPTIKLTHTDQPEFSGDDINITLALKYGADGAAASKPFVVTYEDAAGNKVGPFELSVGGSHDISINGTKVGDLSYSAANKLVFKAVDGTSGTAKITVQATDDDGDITKKDIKFDFMSKPPSVIDFDEKGVFDEGYLKDGSLGSKPDELIRTMDIDPDWKIDTSSGWTQSGSTWTKAYSGGTFTYNADENTLSFKLENAVTHTGKGRDQIEETMNFVLLHKQTGSTSDCTAKLTIKDDIPAVNLTHKDQPEFSGDDITINLALKYGADGAAASKPFVVTYEDAAGNKVGPFEMSMGGSQAIMINGTKVGDLSYSAANKLVFKAVDGTSGTAKITVQATDVDGDTTTKDIKFDFMSKPPSVIDFDEKGVFDEGYLKDGSLGSKPEELTRTMDIDPDWKIDTSSGWTQSGSTWTKAYSGGTFTYNADENTLSFKLENAVTHTGKGRDQVEETMNFVLLHKQTGSTSDCTAKLTIKDDIPAVNLTHKDQPEFSGDDITINLALKYGADGAAASKPFVVTYEDAAGNKVGPFEMSVGGSQAIMINGTKVGDLSYSAANKLVFKAVDGTSGTAKITVQATDVDGDTTTKDIKFDFMSKPPSVIDFDEKGAFDEGYLPNGSLGAKPGELTRTMDIDPDWKIDTSSGWTQSGSTWTKAYSGGTFTYNADENTLSFKLESAVTHTGKGRDQIEETMNFVLQHKQTGSTSDCTAKLTIKDDMPTISLKHSGQPEFSGDDIDITMALKYGADGSASSKPFTVTFADADGNKADPFEIAVGGSQEITINGTKVGNISYVAGKLVFTAEAGTSGTASITVQARDADGDATSKTIKVDYMSKPPSVIDFDEKGLFDEGYLPNGSLGEKPDELTRTMDIDPDWKIDTSDGWTQSGATWTKAYSGGTFTYSTTDNTLSFTLQNAVGHDKEGRDEIEATMNFKLLHKQTNSASDCTAKLTIKDDMPVVDLADQSNPEFSGDDIDIALSLKYGADGKAAAKPFIVVYEDESGAKSDAFEIAVGGSQAITVNGTKVGDLSYVDGKLVFKAVNGTSGKGTFSVTAADADGDTATDSTDVVFMSKPPTVIDFDPEGKFNEGYLPKGSLGSKPTELTKTVDIDPDWKIDTSDGWVAQSGGAVWTKAYSGGKFSYNSVNNTLSFTLSKAVDHEKPDNDLELDVNLDLKLVHKTTATEFDSKVHLTIEDDTPVANFGNTSGTIEGGGRYVGTYDLAHGADGAPATNGMYLRVTNADGGEYYKAIPFGVQSIVIDGVRYGSIGIYANGKFAFRPVKYGADVPAGVVDKLKIEIAIIDHDGDKAESNAFELSLVKPDKPELDLSLTVDEANLPNGSNPDPSALVKTWTLPNGVKPDVSVKGWEHDAATNTYTLSSKTGKFEWVADSNTLTYTLDNPGTHKQPANDTTLTEAFDGFRIVDANGNVYKQPVAVTIKDDNPALDGGKDETIGADNGFVSTDDTGLNVKFGADGSSGKSKDSFTLSVEVETKGFGTSQPAATKSVEVPKDGSPVTVGTTMGTIEFKYDAATDKIAYTYKALRGDEGSSETFILSVKDGDGDVASTDKFTMTLKDPVVEAVLELNEAALSFGSNTDPAKAEEYKDLEEISQAPLAGGTKSIEWNTSSIQWKEGGEVEADGNLDGVYAEVAWVPDGADLVGYADNQPVIRISAIFDNDGNFTGQISAELLRPFEHGPKLLNDIKTLQLKFNQVDANGNKLPSIVEVAIKDDAPFGNETEQGADGSHTIYIEEVPERYEEVFIAFDCSGSLDIPVGTVAGWQVALDALIELIGTYEQNGIQAQFTIVSFASAAVINPQLADISGSDLLALINDVGAETFYNTMRQYNQWYEAEKYPVDIQKGTQFAPPTKLLAQELEKAMADPDRADLDKSVYFLTDGTPDVAPSDDKLDDWFEFLRQHPDDFDVYSIGVGREVNEEAKNLLTDIARGNDEHFIMVEDINNLGDALVGLIKPVTGNLFDGIGSADVNTIQRVWIGESGKSADELKNSGKMYTLSERDGEVCTEEIVLGTGTNVAKIVIYQDGTYRVVAGNVPKDITNSMVIEAKDSDGDVKTSGAIELVVKDAKPEAYDNISILSQFEQGPEHINGAALGASVVDQWRLDGGAFQAKTGAPEIPTQKGDSMDIGKYVGDQVLHLQSQVYNTENPYFEHMGYSMYLSHVVKDVLGLDNAIYCDNDIYRAMRVYSMASTTVTGNGGQITFGWAAKGSQGDASFWLLYDSKGELIKSGVLAEIGNGDASGVAVIDVPIGGDQEYKLVLGTVEGSDRDVRSELFVNAIVYDAADYDFAGNVLTDPSPSGQVDLMYDMAFLKGVKYDGREFHFDETGEIKITGDYGTLIINKNGDYIYEANTDDFKNKRDVFEYIIEDRDGDQSTASLIVEWQPPVAYENVASLNSSGTFSGNVIDDPSPFGETDLHFSATKLASVSYLGKSYDFSASQTEQTIETEQGSLKIDWTGKYTFTPKSGVSSSDVAQEFSYTLAEGTNDQGKLYVQQIEPLAHDNVAGTEGGYFGTSLISSFSDSSLASSGWSSIAGNAALSSTFPSGLLKPQDHEALQSYSDGKYLVVSENSILTTAQQNQIFNLDGGKTAVEYLASIGVGDSIVSSGGNIQGGFASKTFSSTGGTLVFDWSFGGKQNGSLKDSEWDRDAAVYVLQTSDGEIIAAGTLAQLMRQKGDVRKYGVAEINVPISDSEQSYTLYVGQVQACKEGNFVGSTSTQLVLGTMVMMENPYHFAGNLITDASPEGMIDQVLASAKIISVMYAGKEYALSGGKVEITTDSNGTLLVEADGSYYYSDVKGSDGSRVSENFTYKVQNSDGSSSTAELFVRGEEYLHEGTNGDDNISAYALDNPNVPLVISAGNGDDIITCNVAGNVVYAGSGDDTVLGGSGADWIDGGSGADSLIGAAGNDTIRGGAGNDTIDGGTGNDLLFGGAGSNMLKGGRGADTFGWQSAKDLMNTPGEGDPKDTIEDFSTRDKDRLTFGDLLADSTDDGLNKFFSSHIDVSPASLNAADSTLTFTLQDGLFSKNVEMHFVENDSAFAQLVNQYNGAGAGEQEQYIIEFLKGLVS